MSVAARRFALVVLAVSIATGLAVAIDLISDTAPVATPAAPLAPRIATASPSVAVFGPITRIDAIQDVPLRSRVVRRKQATPTQEGRTAPTEIFYSRPFLGDLPVPGGYAAVAFNLGIAPTGSRLR